MAVILFSLPALPGSNLRGNGKNLFWKDGKVTLRVSRTVHWDGGDTGVDRRESAASVHAAVFEAIRSWVRPGRAKVELDLDFTDTRTVSGGESIVTFTDPAPFDTGVCDKDRYITCTLVSFFEDGAIASVAVAFNPYKRHSSTGLALTHDVGLIMMHEMGHVLGLNHSFVIGSAMLTEAEQEPAPGAPLMFSIRGLSEDDLSTLAGLYPLAPVSSIAGTVSRAGAPLAGVRVAAIDADGRVPHGALTGEDGRYRLLVPPGEYRVAAEASDAPAAIESKIVVMEGSAREGVDLVSAASSKPAVDSVGVVLNGFYAGMMHVDLARGRDHSLALTRQPVNLAVDLGMPDRAIKRTGNPSSPAVSPQLVRQAVTVPPDAALGSYGMIVRAGEVSTVLPAPLRIVLNPQIDAITETETGEPADTLRPGRHYTLRGSELSPADSAPAPEFDGAPMPTQVNGIAVRLAGRFVPIVSAKPAQLVFEVPTGVVWDAGDRKLAVVAGTLMESNPVTVKLALE